MHTLRLSDAEGDEPQRPALHTNGLTRRLLKPVRLRGDAAFGFENSSCAVTASDDCGRCKRGMILLELCSTVNASYSYERMFLAAMYSTTLLLFKLSYFHFKMASFVFQYDRKLCAQAVKANFSKSHSTAERKLRIALQLNLK